MAELPHSMDVQLTARVGVACGNNRGGTVFSLSHEVDDDFDVLHAKVKAKVASIDAVTWEDTTDIYLKTGRATKQADFVKLSHNTSDLKKQLKRSWGAHHRSNTNRDFKLCLFVYVKKRNPTLFRATEDRIRSATQRILEHLGSQNEQLPGPTSLRYWGSQLARHEESADVVRPTHTTFRQLKTLEERHRDATRDIERGTVSNDRRTLHLDFGSGVLVPVTVSISQLRSILELPTFDLRSGLQRQQVSAALQGPDVLDAEHRPDDEFDFQV